MNPARWFRRRPPRTPYQGQHDWPHDEETCGRCRWLRDVAALPPVAPDPREGQTVMDEVGVPHPFDADLCGPTCQRPTT